MFKAVFRCDASSFIGGGHVMRCITLADALTAAGWECQFATIPDSLEIVPLLRNRGYNIIDPEQLGAPADLLIVDHYYLDKDFESRSRDWANTIFVIDDLADRKHDCDLLMDQTYGRNPGDYKDITPAECLVLTGTDYALLRAQFSDERVNALSHRIAQQGKVKNILIMLGAGDKENVTSFILRALEAVDPSINTKVIMGAGAPHLEEVKTLAAQSHHKMTVHTNVENVALMMAEADLAIGAGGTASWERCCMGLPSLVIEIADNQRTIIQQLEAAGTIFNLGWYKDVQASVLQEKLLQLLSSPSDVRNMSDKAAQICDGAGATRMAEILNNLITGVNKDENSSIVALS